MDMQTPLHTFCQLLIWKCAWISGDFNWVNPPEGRVSKRLDICYILLYTPVCMAIHFEKSQMGSLQTIPVPTGGPKMDRDGVGITN